MNEEDLAVKIEFIKAFHDNADKRIEFLQWLNKERHYDEALTLCLSYIDSFSQLLFWPSSKKSGENFVKAIADFGGNHLMGLVHPLMAIRNFKSMKSKWQKIAKIIEKVFPGPDYVLVSQDEFLSKLSSSLTSEEFKDLTKECWRSTIAAIAYYYLRNPSIHGFGALEQSFSKTTYKGANISGLDFKVLHGIVKELHNELRRRSESNNQWFGNDEIIHA